MDLTAPSWILAGLAVAAIATIALGAGHLIIETIAATGIGTPAEIVNLIERGA